MYILVIDASKLILICRNILLDTKSNPEPTKRISENTEIGLKRKENPTDASGQTIYRSASGVISVCSSRIGRIISHNSGEGISAKERFLEIRHRSTYLRANATGASLFGLIYVILKIQSRYFSFFRLLYVLYWCPI